MNRRPLTALLLACGLALLLGGCGGKTMTDDDFAAVANTIYENIRAGWDHQANETWDSYYERRIGEACTQRGFEIKTWDKKMREVAQHPDAYKDKLDPDVLAQLLQWQQDRVAAKSNAG
jgi:hypothetical protein